MEEKSLVEIFGDYKAWKLKEKTWIISFMEGSEYMYLLEGEEKALLIDTGYGCGNLRAFAETLTDKTLVVANTHFHPDHAAGNGEFEQVCMSAGYQIDEPSVFTAGAVPFDLSALPYPDYERVVLGDGDVIALGGRDIEVIDVKPAHCNSSLFYLDRTYRMAFCGDEFESAQTIMIDNSKNPDAPYDVKKRLENLKANAEKLKGLSGEYDMLLPNHNGAPIAKEYLEDYIGLVEHIFAGDAVIEDKLNHKYIEMDPRASKICRVRYGNASIFIEKEQVLRVYGNTGGKHD